MKHLWTPLPWPNWAAKQRTRCVTGPPCLLVWRKRCCLDLLGAVACRQLVSRARVGLCGCSWRRTRRTGLAGVGVRPCPRRDGAPCGYVCAYGRSWMLGRAFGGTGARGATGASTGCASALSAAVACSQHAQRRLWWWCVSDGTAIGGVFFGTIRIGVATRSGRGAVASASSKGKGKGKGKLSGSYSGDGDRMSLASIQGYIRPYRLGAFRALAYFGASSACRRVCHSP